MKKISHLLCGIALCCVGAGAIATPAQAQTVDYGSLSEMFGEAVTTSATGKPQRASEVPAAMTIVTAEDIRRSGATDIPTILSRVAGVNVLRTGVSSADIAIRGYNQNLNPRQLVLINGRQVYIDNYGYTSWSTLPVDVSEIRQIEVVKGPNTALFGFNAAAGVINIVTYNPLYDDVNEARIGIGTQLHKEAAGVMTSHSKDGSFGIRMSVNGFKSRDFDKDSSSVSDQGKKSYKNAINADMLYQVNPVSQLGFEASYVVTGNQESIPGSGSTTHVYNIGSAKLAYTYDSDWGLIQAQSYINSDSIKPVLGGGGGSAPPGGGGAPPGGGSAPPGGGGGGGMDKFLNIVVVNQLSDMLKINADHTLRMSLEHRYNTMQVNSTALEDADVFYHDVAAGLMWDWVITPKWSLTNAVRVDHMMLGRKGDQPATLPQTNDMWNDRNINGISYNSGLVWKATDIDTLRLTAGRGLQAPSLNQLGGLVMGAGTSFTTGSPYLDPTVVSNYELGYDRNVALINGSMGAKLFYQLNQDMLLKSGSTVDVAASGSYAGMTYTAVNGGSSREVGIEFEADGKFCENWHWSGNYAFSNIKDDLIASSADRGVRYEGGTPRHVVNLNLGWAKDKWEVDGFVKYQSSFSAYVQSGSSYVWTKGDGYWSVGGRVGYQATDNITVALSGQQLNARYLETSPVQRETERAVLLTTTVKF